ncbi:MAG TPA: hypothetical protein VIK18_19450 [Pirellulales bacterium]
MCSVQSRRHWFRFSLRALLLAVLVASLPLGWWVRTAHRQRQAVGALRELGAWVVYDFEYDDGLHTPAAVTGDVPPQWLRRLLGPDLCGNAVQLDWVPFFASDDFGSDVTPYLAMLPDMLMVQLIDSSMTDADLAELRGWSKIEYLMIESESVTDKSVDTLRGLRSLKFLSIEKTGISPAGYDRLRTALPGTNVRYQHE